MDEKGLFTLALGVEKPWEVVRIEFDEGAGRLDLYLDYPKGSKFRCPEDGQLCGVYDSEERTWRHLNFFQYKAYLHARLPRVNCKRHGVKTVEVSWARPQAGFTLLMEALILALAKAGMTARQIGQMTGEHDTRVWRVLEHYVERSRAQEDYSQVEAVGVDEMSRARGHEYVTNFMDLGLRRVIFSTEGKDAGSLERFREDLEAHGGEAGQVKEFCLDMSGAYIKGIERFFPAAHRSFDRFHLVQLLNEAVDKVRRQEQREHPELKGSRYVWLKNERNLTERQRQRFEQLRTRKLKTVRAYQLRVAFQDYFELEASEAEPFLIWWYNWAIRSRIGPMVEVARTIRRHWQGVVRYHVSRVSNGVLEAIHSLIQAAKRKARGYRSSRKLITMIYLIAGKLDFDLPTPQPVTHTK